MDNPVQSHEVIITGRFPHPIERVFRAWSTPQHIECWLKPESQCRANVVRFDFREGGEYHLHYSWDAGTHSVHGKFLTIVPEKSVIFSWTTLPPDPYAGRETMVSVWFRSLSSDLTEVELRHTLFPDQVMRDCHNFGWSAAFALLTQHLQAGR